MEYIEKNDGIERIYFVSYNREELVKLLDEIIKKASYRVQGVFASNNACVDFDNNKFVSCKFLPNGDSMFENIKGVYSNTSDGEYSFNNGSIVVEGTQVISPQLAFIIDGILNDDNDSINRFLNYPTHSELIPIEKKIKIANEAVDRINNFDFDEKIKALNILKKYCEEKKLNQYYNTDLLKQYYLKAQSLIELKLISEKNFNKVI